MISSSHLRRGTLAAAAATLAVGATLAAPAQADPLLQRFEGQWVGRGEVVMEPGGQPRSAFCRISAKLAQDGTVLEQSGRCAAGEDTRRISARVVAQGGDFYAGSWDAGMGSAQVSGTAQENLLNLVLESGGGIPEGASPTITLRFGQSGAYVMEMTGVDPNRGRFDVGRIVFEREN
ncbi:hypothetical protein [Lutibaculum baratangense]|uniref:Uncharacterized protein n=1 Tax=Lutibaculum baratangense AMV1 TaxID=631454 RepID=V4RHV6_9HYPH|nr:hypothetical protein [Lutibaculum baratangense]ESR22850.1 hypothetical protein N177_3987 [Lutibaculum baratangense AMV1]